MPFAPDLPEQFGDISSKSYLQMIFEEEMNTTILSTSISFRYFMNNSEVNSRNYLQMIFEEEMYTIIQSTIISLKYIMNL